MPIPVFDIKTKSDASHIHDEVHFLYLMRKVLKLLVNEDALSGGLTDDDIIELHTESVRKIIESEGSHYYGESYHPGGMQHIAKELDDTLPDDLKKATEGYGSENVSHILSDKFSSYIQLSEDSIETYEILRTGTFSHPLYGKLEITKEMLEEMVNNFNNNVMQRKIAIDAEHYPENGAYGIIKSLSIKEREFKTGIQSVLVANIKWNRLGKEALKDGRYSYFSASFIREYKDKETGENYGAVLTGAALTTRPFIPGLAAVDENVDFKDIFLMAA